MSLKNFDSDRENYLNKLPNPEWILEMWEIGRVDLNIPQLKHLIGPPVNKAKFYGPIYSKIDVTVK